MDDLPDEIISAILSYLDPVSMLKASSVNRRFYEIATDPLLHRSVSFESSKYLPENFIATYIKRFGTNLLSLQLQDCYWLKLPVISTIQTCCWNLTHLNLLGCTEIPVHMVVTIFKKNSRLCHFGWTVGLDLMRSLKNLNTNQGRHALEQLKALSILFEDLISLKLGLIVYPTSIYNDGFEPEAILFTNLISRIVSPRLQKLSVICLDRGQFMHQPKLSRVLLEVSIKLKVLKDSTAMSSVDLHDQFTSARAEVANYGAISSHGSIIKGWIKYLLIQKSQALRTIAAVGPPFLNFWIPLFGNSLRMCDITTVQVLDISFCHDVPVYWMVAVLKANSLRVLNLSHMECVSGNLLKVLAEGSPYLESLNLQGCHDCLEPIEGLQSIAKKCNRLCHLNLGGIHYHTTKSQNILLDILSTMKHLLSVGLSGCSITSQQQDCSSSESEDSDLVELAASEEIDDEESSSCQSTSSDDLEVPTCHSDDLEIPVCYSNSLEVPACHRVNLKDPANQEELSYCSGLLKLSKHCSFLQEVELINSGFHSVLRKGWLPSRPPPERSHLIFDCPEQQSEMLDALAYCECLQRLTLAGLDIRGGLEFLVKIACSCTQLQYLSLAQLRGLEMSVLPTLTKALSRCQSLKQFRFEQSYFAVPESFTMALSNATSLEALCIITKGGSIAVSTILPLFDKCRRLRVLQVCADASSSEETFKNITNILYNKYSCKRPGLAVCLFPYDSNTRDLHDKLFNHSHENSFPLIHLKNLSLFGSEVATRMG